MDDEASALAYVTAVLDYLGIPYAIGGGWAVGVWSTPRLTHDVDIVVDLQPEQAPAFCAEFPLDQFYLDAAAMARQFRQLQSPSRGMYSFYHIPSGLKIDLFPLRQTDPVEVAAFGRRVAVEILPDQIATVCTAQDLLVQKLRWWELGGRQSEVQRRDCVQLLLTDLAHSTPQILWAEVERITQSLGPPIHEAWHMIQATVQQVLQSPP